MFETNTTADIRCGCTVPTSAFGIVNAGMDPGTQQVTTGERTNNAGNSDWQGGTFNFGVETLGTAGTIQITFAQSAATVVDTIVYKNSLLFYRAVAL